MIAARTSTGTANELAGLRVSLSGDGVAVVEWRTGAPRNAWNGDTDDAFAEALASCDEDSSVRVVVLRGAGGDFCAGRDMGGLRSAAGDGAQRRLSHGIDRTRLVRKPVIAVVEGACAGIGLTLALLADVRFASQKAVFSTSFVRRGLPAGHATAWLLTRAVGHARASELLLSGRRFDGPEAERLGLVTRAVEPDRLEDHVTAYAQDIATRCSPRSLGIIKRQLSGDLRRPYEDALAESEALAIEAFATPDFQEGVASYQERRLPSFPSLGPVESGPS